MSPTESQEMSVSALPAVRRQYALAKRILDITLCLAFLPLAMALMLLISLAICLESPGAAVFAQERAGRGGRRFRFYKFRTMKYGYDDRKARQFMKAYVRGQLKPHRAGGAVYKPDHKAHITRVGRVLRRTSLDELPQIVNVLKGDMSLVGPRPHVVWEVEEYLPWHSRRLEVLPGITGLAQVKGRSGISFEQMVLYDLQYVQERSLKLDLKILWWTLLAVARGRGAA